MTKSIAALFLLTSWASTPTAQPKLPDRSDAVDAFFEWEADTCRALIDVCETGVLRVRPELIEKLRCRKSSAGAASCHFDVLGYRCEAQFASLDAGADYQRSVSWSSLGTAADQLWAVGWPDRIYQGPRVKCAS